MTTYGQGFITISTGITGTPSEPSGDWVILWCPRYSFNDVFSIKPIDFYNGTSLTPVKGKVKRKVKLNKCQVYSDDGGTTNNTDSLREQLTFLRQPQKIDGNPVYLIIVSENDNENLPLSEGTSGALDYMKGYITSFNVIPMGGHYEVDIGFMESTN